MQFDDSSPSAEGQLQLGKLLAGLEDQLRLILALECSATLRKVALDGREAVELQAPVKAGSALLEPNGLHFGERPSVVADVIAQPFVELLQSASVRAAIDGSLPRKRPARSAADLMMGLVRDDRRYFQMLLEYTPLVAPAVYAISAQTAAVLDTMRDEVRSAYASARADRDQRALGYYGLVRLMERATLLATDAGGDWLVGMAGSFEWVNWTPSFTLARERTLAGALVAARAASRFGTGVIDGYLDVLATAVRPIKFLDAIAALAAIGLRFPAERDSIMRHLEDAAARLPSRTTNHTEVVEEAIRQALSLLAKGRTPSPLVLSDWRSDSYSRDGVGHMFLIRMLMAAVEAPAWQFVPGPSRPRRLSLASAKDSFARAWGVELTDDAPWAARIAGHA